MAVIIELLNNQGKSVGIHKFTQNDIRIGRSYDNDVILLDPHSCAEHAILSCDEQGHWQLRDLDSANGTLSSSGQRIQKTTIPHSGQEFILGKQRLRVFFAAASVAPTRILAKGWQSLRLLSSVPLLILLLLLVSAYFSYEMWLGAIGEAAENWHRQLLSIPFILLALLLWPALLALWARLRSQESNFRPQVTLILLITASWLLWSELSRWLSFNFSQAMLVEVLQLTLPAVLLVVLFWNGFKLAGMQRKSLQLVLTIVLASTYWLVPYMQAAGPQIMPQYQAELLSQPMLISTPKNPEVFLTDSASLFDKATQSAKQP
ncbi:MAG: FHA domain-containing protein [Alishewanella sp.]|nr:FHA domain-containing protein [Alishewanella sp.]